jgi:hypothetical protein
VPSLADREPKLQALTAVILQAVTRRYPGLPVTTDSGWVLWPDGPSVQAVAGWLAGSDGPSLTCPDGHRVTVRPDSRARQLGILSVVHHRTPRSEVHTVVLERRLTNSALALMQLRPDVISPIPDDPDDVCLPTGWHTPHSPQEQIALQLVTDWSGLTDDDDHDDTWPRIGTIRQAIAALGGLAGLAETAALVTRADRRPHRS